MKERKLKEREQGGTTSRERSRRKWEHRRASMTGNEQEAEREREREREGKTVGGEIL